MSTKKYIHIKKANVHNLKNITLKIPKEELIVISGVSGSGKSSLAFDTIFTEGQRRYIESLSSYARQFLGKLQKPKVEKIIGLTPSIAIEQNIISKNPRSTVGTVTEIYDYLKLLFSKIGKIYSPISGNIVKKDRIEDIVKFMENKENKECHILIEIINHNTSYFKKLLQEGFSRILYNNKILKIEDILISNKTFKESKCYLIIDRLKINKSNDLKKRLYESTETAFNEGGGQCLIKIDNKKYYFSNKYELDGLTFEKKSIHLFTFNSPYGACKKCQGFGRVLGLDKDKIIKNKSLSVYEGAVCCWSGLRLSKWKEKFIINSSEYNFPIHKPYNQLSKEELKLLWDGNKQCKGIYHFFEKIESKMHKIQNRVILARYRGATICNECQGSRLRKDALYIKINGKSIAEITNMSIKECLIFFKKISLSEYDKKISKDIILEIINRLVYLSEVGLTYLTLSRNSSTLSGGESQRIRLATSLGSNLVGSTYVLDEPSIGLHPEDTKNLIKILKNLRDIGNTVIIVEHDQDIMEEADQIIVLGPKAGVDGGEIIFQGKLSEIYKKQESLTTKYLSNEIKIEYTKKKRKWKHKIELKGVNINNISNLNVNIPLECLTLITGLSGSGKSSLIKGAVKPALEEIFELKTPTNKSYSSSKINTNKYTKIKFIDQNPIGKSSRSNPVTYIKAYDDIRKCFSQQKLSKKRKYNSGYFSFNVDGGRCENCKGEGEQIIEMQFMADVRLVCDECNGKKFKEEVLEILFDEKNISEVLNLTINEAINFFNKNKEYKISQKIQPLKDVGLGYMKLGQSSSTLSGGEAQRIKLASFLGKKDTIEKVIFIFDEPTTGLHFHDINKLLQSFNALIEKGHSIICIEHNLDVIKCADWIIDLGPSGGKDGGKIIFEGLPDHLINYKDSITGKHLKKKIKS